MLLLCISVQRIVCLASESIGYLVGLKEVVCFTLPLETLSKISVCG